MKKELIEKHKQLIIETLEKTERSGIKGLIEYMTREDFFISPASTRFHGAEPGGLADHSWDVYNLLLEAYLNFTFLDTPLLPGQKPLPIETNNIVIAGLLHDVCKLGAYIPTPDGKNPYRWNRKQPKGHASLSIKRIKKFIKLTELEEMMIRFHMGLYGLIEAYDENDWQKGEYHIRGDHSKDDQMTKEQSQKARYGQSLMNAWFHNPIVKLMYFCDEQATMWNKTEYVKNNPIEG
jgi:23S rRNA maturation-related 3'-5' exoribonuclease YhaM